MGGAGPIPLTEILAYMQMFEISDVDERTWLLRVVGKMDSVYLAHNAKKNELKSRH